MWDAGFCDYGKMYGKLSMCVYVKSLEKKIIELATLNTINRNIL